MTVLAIVAAGAVAAAVQVVSGFGFSLVAAPVVVAVTDPVTTVSMLAVAATLVSAVTLAAGRHRPEVLGGTAAALIAWALPGVALGVLIVSRLPADAIRAAIGLLVLAALVQRHVPALRPHGGSARPWALPAAGAASGALTTSTGLNGPPLVVYLTARDVPSRTARDTLALIFVVLGLLATLALGVSGELTLPTETLALLPAAALGALLGHRVFDRLDERRRGAVVTGVLVLAAATALSSALT